MKFCEKCGEQLMDEAVMCPKCKYIFVKTANHQQNNDANKRMFCLLGAFAIIIFVIIAVCYQL